MPQRSGITGPPNSYVASGEWPDGRLKDSAPTSVRYARAISRRLRGATERTAVSLLADDADVARSTIHDILAGRTWPDVVSLAKLEAASGVRLWPSPDELES